MSRWRNLEKREVEVQLFPFGVARLARWQENVDLLRGVNGTSKDRCRGMPHYQMLQARQLGGNFRWGIPKATVICCQQTGQLGTVDASKVGIWECRSLPSRPYLVLADATNKNHRIGEF